MVMTSYDLFVGEVDLRSLATKRQMILEEESDHMPYFNIKKEDWVVYFVIALISVLAKWADERYASNFAKNHGMERHVLMKVHFYSLNKFTATLNLFLNLCCV